MSHRVTNREAGQPRPPESKVAGIDMRDADIRRVVLGNIRQKHEGEPDTRIVNELGLRQGSVRVDLAVVNGTLHGYEIKSVVDTLRRLPTQAGVYSQVLDYVTIVLAERHRDEAVQLVPVWWEVIVAEDTSKGVPNLVVWREGSHNPCVDRRALAELLWRQDALEMLRARNALHGVATKPRSYIWDRLCAVCTVEEIAEAVREKIKGRATHQVARWQP